MWLAHFILVVGIVLKTSLSNNKLTQLSLLKINLFLNNFRITPELFIGLALTETSSGVDSHFFARLKIEVVELSVKR